MADPETIAAANRNEVGSEKPIIKHSKTQRISNVHYTEEDEESKDNRDDDDNKGFDNHPWDPFNYFKLEFSSDQSDKEEKEINKKPRQTSKAISVVQPIVQRTERSKII